MHGHLTPVTHLLWGQADVQTVKVIDHPCNALCRPIIRPITVASSVRNCQVGIVANHVLNLFMRFILALSGTIC